MHTKLIYWLRKAWSSNLFKNFFSGGFLHREKESSFVKFIKIFQKNAFTAKFYVWIRVFFLFFQNTKKTHLKIFKKVQQLPKKYKENSLINSWPKKYNENSLKNFQISSKVAEKIQRKLTYKFSKIWPHFYQIANRISYSITHENWFVSYFFPFFPFYVWFVVFLNRVFLT